MQEPPETRYVRTPEGSVAYQVLGDGPRDVLFIQNWASNIEVMWLGDRVLTARRARAEGCPG